LLQCFIVIASLLWERAVISYKTHRVVLKRARPGMRNCLEGNSKSKLLKITDLDIKREFSSKDRSL